MEDHELILIPTTNRTNIICPTVGVGKYQIHHIDYYGSADLEMGDQYQHIYILENTIPKIGEWYAVPINYGRGGKWVWESIAIRGENETFSNSDYKRFGAKKIIMSNDPRLLGMELSEKLEKYICLRYENDNNIKNISKEVIDFI